MKRFLRRGAIAAAVILAPLSALAQNFEAAGTRALGMGGAFVGVADDASAVYWNPAGLAGGAYFSILLDRTEEEAKPPDSPWARGHSGGIIALSTPALGLGYYRLRTTSLTPLPTLQPADVQALGFRADGVYRVDTLLSHHGGVTLVQSLGSNLAVGTTLKLVRGIVASAIEPSGDRGGLLDEGANLIGKATTRFDADVGVMATLGGIRAGLTVRNLREPEFDAPGGEPAERLERQARAGISARPLGLLVAADVDLTKSDGPLGETRNLAAGAELRILPRAYVRAGLRVNTIADMVSSHSRVVAFGGSYAVMGSAFIDAQVSKGAGAGGTGWGVAGRLLF